MLEMCHCILLEAVCCKSQKEITGGKIQCIHLPKRIQWVPEVNIANSSTAGRSRRSPENTSSLFFHWFFFKSWLDEHVCLSSRIYQSIASLVHPGFYTCRTIIMVLVSDKEKGVLISLSILSSWRLSLKFKQIPTRQSGVFFKRVLGLLAKDLKPG